MRHRYLCGYWQASGGLCGMVCRGSRDRTSVTGVVPRRCGGVDDIIPAALIVRTFARAG